MISVGVIDGPIAILGVARTGAASSPGSQFTLPTVSDDALQTFKAGDVAIYCQLAESSDASIPEQVIPSGWTTHTAGTFATGAGRGARIVSARKILTSADIGATFTGMNGTGRNRVCCITFAMSRAVQAITSGGAVQTATSGSEPPAQVITASGQTGNVLVVAQAHGEIAIPTASFVWTPSAIGSAYIADPNQALGLSESTTRNGFSYYPYTTPANQTVDIPSRGDFAVLTGAYFLLT